MPARHLFTRLSWRAATLAYAIFAALLSLAVDTRAQAPAKAEPPKPILAADTVKRIVAKAVERPQGKSVLAQREWSRRTIEVTVDGERKTIVASKQGAAPTGYLKGMSLLYAEAYVRWKAKDQVMLELARAPVAADPDSEDALSRLRRELGQQAIDVGAGGVDTPRGLYVLLFELGMRESSGRYFIGRDFGRNKSQQELARTDNLLIASETEAGPFQSSYNITVSSPLARRLFEGYRIEQLAEGERYRVIFAEGLDVPKSLTTWGAGPGVVFQGLSKADPKFAIEVAGAGLRAKCSDYNSMRYKLVDISREAADLFRQVEAIVDAEKM